MSSSGRRSRFAKKVALLQSAAGSLVEAVWCRTPRISRKVFFCFGPSAQTHPASVVEVVVVVVVEVVVAVLAIGEGVRVAVAVEAAVSVAGAVVAVGVALAVAVVD